MENELRLKLDQSRVEARLAQLLPRRDELTEAMGYSLLAGGKLLRPVLVLAFCRACGGEDEGALDAACGLEMLHTYTLIHDDLPCMDDDALRRGKPTCHVVYGEWLALLAGDALQAEAFRAVLCAPLAPEVRARAAEILALAAGWEGVCGGQYLDLSGEGQALSEGEIREMYRLKTGALFRAACEMGCACAGADREMQEAAGRYGELLGLAFQIRDDLLDLESTEEALGKPIGSDERNEKSTLAACLGREEARKLLAQCSTEAAQILARRFGGDAFLCWLTEMLASRSY